MAVTLDPESYGVAVDAIYATIETPDTWVAALAAIARCTDDVGAIFIYPRGDGSLGSIVTPGLEAVQARFQSPEWATRDLRYERAFERGYVASGQCVTDRHVASDDEIEAHPYYAELLRPHGLKYFAGMNVSPSPGAGAALSVQRGPEKAPFSDEELETVSRLGKHVEAALRIGVRLTGGAGPSTLYAGRTENAQESELSRMFARLAAF